MKTLKEKLKATERNLYVDDSVLESSPEKIEGTLEYFKLDKYISCEVLEQEYAKRKLIPADIHTLIEHDSELDEKKYVGTQWKDKDGKWCFASFYHWFDGERSVFVHRDDDHWDGHWWFAGVRKSSEISNSELIETLPLTESQAISFLKNLGFKITKLVEKEY